MDFWTRDLESVLVKYVTKITIPFWVNDSKTKRNSVKLLDFILLQNNTRIDPRGPPTVPRKEWDPRDLKSVWLTPRVGETEIARTQGRNPLREGLGKQAPWPSMERDHNTTQVLSDSFIVVSWVSWVRASRKLVVTLQWPRRGTWKGTSTYPSARMRVLNWMVEDPIPTVFVENGGLVTK